MKKEITISDKMKTVMDNGIRIFPKFDINHRFAVHVEDPDMKLYDEIKKTGKYEYTTRTINDAIIKTLEFTYKKLITKN